MIFSLENINELLNVIEKYNIIFINEQLGTKFLTVADKYILRKAGLSLKNVDFGSLDNVYKFGIIAESLKDSRTKGMTYDEFKKFVTSKNFIPLTDLEESALESVKYQTYNDIKTLSQRIKSNISNNLNKLNKQKSLAFSKIIDDTAKKAILMRQTQNELAMALRDTTQNWIRDFDRIAACVMHDAYDQGRAQSIIRIYGEDAKVYKDVYEYACDDCIRLYLTNGLGSAPKIFKISELIANGSNIGKSSKDWLPVIGFTHPYCRCTLSNVLKNNKYNPDTQMFEVKRNNQGIKRTSKIKVTIEP
jgi:hypothetical protein